MFRPDLDPGAAIEIDEHKAFFRAKGRHPRAGELDEWLSEMRDAARVAEEKYDERRRKEVEEQEKQRLARQRTLDDRLRNRNRRPPKYVPPMTCDELRHLIAQGQSHLAETQLTGAADKYLVVDFDLERVNLSGAKLHNVRFVSGADLRDANFGKAEMTNVTFEGCDISGADFSSVQFENVTFEENVQLKEAIFRDAKFRGRYRIEFDKNDILGARFFSGRTDTWFKLYSYYSGIWQFINVGLFAAYFGPVLLKVYLFDLLARTQERGTNLADQTVGLYLSNVMSNLTFESVSLWNFVFGERVSTVLTTLLFAFYQVFRLHMTLKISPLIHVEEHTGNTPERGDYFPLRSRHNLLRLVGVMVAVVILFEFYEISQLTISVPRGRS